MKGQSKMNAKAQRIINDGTLLRYGITDENDLLEVEIHQEYETTDEGDEIIQDPAPWWLTIGTADQSNADVDRGLSYQTEHIFSGGPYPTKMDAMNIAHDEIMALVK